MVFCFLVTESDPSFVQLPFYFRRLWQTTIIPTASLQDIRLSTGRRDRQYGNPMRSHWIIHACCYDMLTKEVMVVNKVLWFWDLSQRNIMVCSAIVRNRCHDKINMHSRSNVTHLEGCLYCLWIKRYICCCYTIILMNYVYHRYAYNIHLLDILEINNERIILTLWI